MYSGTSDEFVSGQHQDKLEAKTSSQCCKEFTNPGALGSHFTVP